jgi:SAM-dependent methyltransferase
MAKMQLRSDYLHHEYIYAANPTVSGWNLPSVDQEILTYIEELLQEAQMLPPARVLELGCGMGNLTIPLTCKGFNVVGMDISTTAIEAAKKRAFAAGINAQFRVGDAISAKSYDSSKKYECILDGLIWHCIIGDDRKVLLEQVYNNLEPNGCFLGITMCGDPCSAKLRDYFDSRSRCITYSDIAQRYLGYPEKLVVELTEAGFQVIYNRVVVGNLVTGDQNMLLVVAIKKSRSHNDYV